MDDRGAGRRFRVVAAVETPAAPAGSSRGLVAALGVLGCGVVVWWLSLLAVPHGVERVEVHVLSLVLWWRSGVVPYLPLDGLPFLQNPYGPLFEGLAALLPAGPGPYFAGRLVSITAFLATLVLVGVATFRRSGRLALAVVASLLPLSAKPVLLFAPLYRVDSLGLFLSVAGFLVATSRRGGSARSLAAAVLFLLAFLTKMTFLAAPLAAALVLARTDRRRALILAAAVGVVFPAAVVALELATGGAYLASAASGNLPTAAAKSLDLVARMLLSAAWLLALGLAARRDRRLLAAPAALYAAVALAVAAAFAANPLSSWNYLLETYVALALWTGDALAVRPGPSRPVLRALAVHVVASFVLVPLWLFDWSRRLDSYRADFQVERAALAGRVEPGTRVAVPGSLAARDAVNALGGLNLVAAPESLIATLSASTTIDAE